MNDVVAASISIAIPLAVFGFLIAAGVNILRKAGYSGWFAVGALIPFVNVILLLLFAFRRWPIEGEILRLRMKCGEVSQDDVDALCDEALKMEMRGDWSKALESYEAVARFSKDSEVAHSAQISGARLLDKMRESA